MTDHPIPPVFDSNSRVLILGSFPSVRSRQEGFFYGHPMNRFWQVLSAVFGDAVPMNTEEKRALLLRNRIALWDVIESCDITGSADSSIRNVKPNDLTEILNTADIHRIYVNGKTSQRYYNKYIRDKIGVEAVCLPSTSAANAAWSLEALINEWKIIKTEVT